jgi:hypothetical protein
LDEDGEDWQTQQQQRREGQTHGQTDCLHRQDATEQKDIQTVLLKSQKSSPFKNYLFLVMTTHGHYYCYEINAFEN